MVAGGQDTNHREYASINSNTFRNSNSSPLAAIEAGLTSGITRIRTSYTTSTGMPDHSWKRAWLNLLYDTWFKWSVSSHTQRWSSHNIMHPNDQCSVLTTDWLVDRVCLHGWVTWVWFQYHSFEFIVGGVTLYSHSCARFRRRNTYSRMKSSTGSHV